MRLTREQLQQMGYEEIQGHFVKMTGKRTGEVVTQTLNVASQTFGVPKRKPVKSPEEKLNKLERRWLEELKRRGYNDIKVQAIKLQLGHDCLYLPDFFTQPFSFRERQTFWETKGHRWAKNMIKLRVAARVHNWARFILVEWKDNKWTETEIKP